MFVHHSNQQSTAATRGFVAAFRARWREVTTEPMPSDAAIIRLHRTYGADAVLGLLQELTEPDVIDGMRYHRACRVSADALAMHLLARSRSAFAELAADDEKQTAGSCAA